jgi:integrase
VANRKGYIRKRSAKPAEGRKSKWQARYQDPLGNWRTKQFDRKVDAERWLQGQETDIRRGEWLDPRRSDLTFETWARTWLDSTVHLKPKTRLGYESLLRSHVLPRFGRFRLGEIERLDIQRWVAALHEDRGLSPARVRQAYQVLAAALKAAVQSRLLIHTPCIGIKLPRAVAREMKFLSADEVARLAWAIREPYEVLVHLLAYGGLRWGEAVALRWRRIDLDKRRIEVAESVAEIGAGFYPGAPKNWQRRTVAIPGLLADLFRAYRKETTAGPDDLVFGDEHGNFLRHSNFRNRVWIPAVAAAGLPAGLRIHDMRHTCAALLIAQGAHPKAIQVHLGHSSIQVTMDRYGHLFPSEWDRIAESLDETARVALEGYQFGYQSDDGNVVSLEEARLTRSNRGGAGWTRTSDRRIMSPLL